MSDKHDKAARELVDSIGDCACDIETCAACTVGRYSKLIAAALRQAAAGGALYHAKNQASTLRCEVVELRAQLAERDAEMKDQHERKMGYQYRALKAEAEIELLHTRLAAAEAERDTLRASVWSIALLDIDKTGFTVRDLIEECRSVKAKVRT
jgi:hypothetical protein